MTYMFAYGMNTNKKQMAGRCPYAIPIGHAVLAGHEFRFAGCADIVPNSHREVHGVLWKITDQCLAALDVLEGYPSFYNRKSVLVKHKNEFHTSLVYFMNPGNELWPPSSMYVNMLTEGYQDFNVPKNQLNVALSVVKNITASLTY